MADHELCWMPASKLAAAIARKKVSPVEVVEAVLDRIEKLEHLTYPFNMPGTPAASVPWGLTKDGLTLGLQTVGRPGDELTRPPGLRDLRGDPGVDGEAAALDG